MLNHARDPLGKSSCGSAPRARTRRAAIAALAGVAVMWMTGACHQMGATRPEPIALTHTFEHSSPRAPGLIWMFPGVEGGPYSLTFARMGLRDAGVDADIRTHDWNRPFGVVTNLIDHEGNLRDARCIADEIAAYLHDHPDATVDLVGYSGGGGLAIMVAEALPQDGRLRNVILCHPALSPDYDLNRTMLRVSGLLVHYYSPHDWFLLGIGTSLLGTMDRQRSAAAGMTGFTLARSIADDSMMARIEQRAWTTDMIKCGHFGGHAGMFSYAWNKEYVAPYLIP